MRCLITALLVCTANQLVADTVPIIVGQQQDATRFVATIPVGTNWISRNVEGAFFLQLPVEHTFDITRLTPVASYDDRPITVMQQKDNEIAISFDCMCEGSAFVYRDVFLVVDIREREEAPTSSNALPSTEPDLISGLWWRERVIQRERLDISDALSVAHDTELSEPDFFVPERLARELSSTTLSGRAELRQQSSGELEVSVAPDIASLTDGQPVKIGVTTSQADSQPSDISPEIDFCNEYGAQNIFDSQTQQPDYNSVIASRSLIYSNAGSPDPAKLVDLAIDYLRFAMAIEARLALQEVPTNTDEKDLISQIANIIAGSKIDKEFWNSARNCENSLYFWSTLDETATNREIKSELVLLYFKAAPSWLQTHLFERLHNVFIMNGEASAAEELVAYFGLNEAQESADTEAEYQEPPAKTDLQNANRDNPETMVSLLASSSDEDLVLSSEAIRFEQRDTALWFDLVKAEIVAELQGNRFSSALAKLAELSQSDASEDDVSLMADQVFSHIAQNANDTDFLASYFQKGEWPLSQDVVASLERRMSNFELPGITSTAESENVTSEPENTNTTEVQEPDIASESAITELDSATIRALLTDTQNLRSSVLEELSIRAE